MFSMSDNSFIYTEMQEFFELNEIEFPLPPVVEYPDYDSFSH